MTLPSFQEQGCKSTLVSRNITIFGKRTSVRLEPEMWASLHDIARRERCSIHDVCSLISMRKQAGTSLTAAIRVFVMLYFKAASTEQGHVKAGHGNFELMKRRAKVPEIHAEYLGKRRRPLSALKEEPEIWQVPGGKGGSERFVRP